MTEKLYYVDAYISEFTATVTGCDKCDVGYRITLDKTAFFPEEGGQTADSGYISNAFVSDVREIGEYIYHYTDKPLLVGECVACKLNFEQRFEKMQLHTAEHIVCGIIHKLWGYENVGFHLGDDVVTFDVDSPMSREMLDMVEDEANLSVVRNLRVSTSFPSAFQLAEMKYRSKLDIKDGIRIVTIGDVDNCACCAPHVNMTGEIGVIKILDFEKHRGGCRIYLTAGKRAFADYRRRYELTKKISGALSRPQFEIDSAVDELLVECDGLRYQLKMAQLNTVKLLADKEMPVDGCKVFDIPNVGTESLREFCNIMGEKSRGVVVAISGADSLYRFVMYSGNNDISDVVKPATATLGGKGGGRGAMATGTFTSDAFEIRRYFENCL